ncbi:hypothetical protein BIV57_07475 [Mangrovactinospora gilvigrisea]|uniref:EcsC family protein n=1 Tax=Mangrovactinospora gilvigrisea TaxID=1428644 RepID=A0A1J7BHB8_9ACTN|nr:hypothetical protein [Mangrovactinospora gilvigrisea]OIV38091.1 hypothetical protein BIV57_07475 [Mangrovactinospora gilvigrisea]
MARRTGRTGRLGRFGRRDRDALPEGQDGPQAPDGDESSAADLIAGIAALPPAPSDDGDEDAPEGVLVATQGPEGPDGRPGRNGDRKRLLAALRAALGRGAGAAGRAGARAAHAGGKGAHALADRLIEAAPRIPVRRLESLRQHHPGLGTEELADKLVKGAERSTAAVGAGIGAAAVLPNPMTMPVELAAETLAVAAIEFKLVAELHEAYGIPAQGNGRQRSMAYLVAWADQRGIDPRRPTALGDAFSSTAKRDLRNRLIGRMARSAPSLTPFLIGAGVGATMNHRDTHKLAEKIRRDLRRRAGGEGRQLPEGDGSADRALSRAETRRLGKRVDK